MVFKAEHARTFNEKLSIDISQRDFADAPGGIPYDVSGACVRQLLLTFYHTHLLTLFLTPVPLACLWCMCEAAATLMLIIARFKTCLAPVLLARHCGYNLIDCCI